MSRKAAAIRKPEPDLARREYLCRACVQPIGMYANIAFPLLGACDNCGSVTSVAVIKTQPAPQPRLEFVKVRPSDTGGV